MQTTSAIVNRDMTRPSRWDVFRAVPAVALILAASGINFLRYHDYPLLSADVGLFAGFLGTMALGMSAFYVIRNRYFRAFLETGIVFLAVDLNMTSPIATVAAGGTFVYLILKGGTLLPILSVMFGVAFLASLADLGETRSFIDRKEEQSPTSATDRPAVLHLILDEHIGIEGLPATNPEAVRLKNELKASYMAQGFRVYGGAYSEHLYTMNAIPDILNFGGKSGAKSDIRTGVILGESSYFEAMKNYGYRTNIVQPHFVDYCSSSAYASCITYWPNSLKLLRDQFTAQERASLMFFKFLYQSELIEKTGIAVDDAAARIGSRLRLDLERRMSTSAVGALLAFDVLNSQLIRARPGELYFMHVLAPHYPYVARKDCSLRPPAEWQLGWSSTERQSGENAYLEQVRCVTGKVEAAVRALSQSPAKDNFVVIVHGDHGSRITRVDPDEAHLGSFDDADMVAGFSTLFALKGPGLEPGYESHAAPVAFLLGQWVEGEFRTPPVPGKNEGPAQVYLGDRYWKPKLRHPLPQRWLDALAEVSP